MFPSIFCPKLILSDKFSVQLSDPLNGFQFNNICSNFADKTSAIANTQIDWKEMPEAHVLKADLPGFKKEELDVVIKEGKVLQISGMRSSEKVETNEKWHRIERSSGEFSRRLQLPENARVNQVEAVMEDGVLTVTVPKGEVKNSGMKSIEISD